jgi:type IV pilus assembly protein PilQ
MAVAGDTATQQLAQLDAAASAAQEIPPRPQYQGEAISLKLVDVSLIDFFRTISELTGLNILIDPDVQGTITINVEEVPWDLLFETVLKSHGLQRNIEGNLVRIATKRTLQQEEVATQALKKAAFDATDTLTITRHLNYSSAKALVKALEKQLSKRGQINFDERTNTLIVTDVRSNVDQLLRLVKTLDIPEKQVEIESRIVEATTLFTRQLGSELGLLIGTETDRVVTGLDVFAPVAVNKTFGLAGIGVGKLMDSFKMDAILTAGESKGDARILSRPRISAQNNAQAMIAQGAKIPIPVQQNFTTTVRYERAALVLTVTPQVTEEQTILLNIRVENNVPDFSRTVLGIPIILLSESETMVLVPDGGTTVIGGIFVEQDRGNVDSVPGLGSVPVIGNLFRRSNKSRETREILFFLTTKIKT